MEQIDFQKVPQSTGQLGVKWTIDGRPPSMKRSGAERIRTTVGIEGSSQPPMASCVMTQSRKPLKAEECFAGG